MLQPEETEQTQFFTARLAHYSRRLRATRKISQDQLAKQLRLSSATICRIENQQHTKHSAAIQELSLMGALDKLSLHEFFNYIFQTTSLQSAVHPWQRFIMNKIMKLNSQDRIAFTQIFVDSNIEEVMSCINHFLALKPSKRKLILSLLKELR